MEVDERQRELKFPPLARQRCTRWKSNSKSATTAAWGLNFIQVGSASCYRHTHPVVGSLNYSVIQMKRQFSLLELYLSSIIWDPPCNSVVTAGISSLQSVSHHRSLDSPFKVLLRFWKGLKITQSHFLQKLRAIRDIWIFALKSMLESSSVGLGEVLSG